MHEHGKGRGVVLQQYAAETGVYPKEQVERDFVQIREALPHQDVSQGLSDAIRFGQTPPFDQVVSQLFEQGDCAQRADMLRHLLDGAGPALARSLAKIVPQPRHDGAAEATDITPELAAQLDPDLVRRLAHEAHEEDPAVVDRLSGLFAGDPALAATLGSGTLGAVMGKIAESR